MTYCIAWRNLVNTLRWPMWDENLKKNGYMYVYTGITLLYSRNYDNIVSQLYFNKTLKMKIIFK